jgi:hypothetical protein
MSYTWTSFAIMVGIAAGLHVLYGKGLMVLLYLAWEHMQQVASMVAEQHRAILEMTSHSTDLAEVAEQQKEQVQRFQV